VEGRKEGRKEGRIAVILLCRVVLINLKYQNINFEISLKIK
jgi:hypothetical protein